MFIDIIKVAVLKNISRRLHTVNCKIPSSTLLTFTIPEIVTTSPGTQLSTEVESESTNIFLTLYIVSVKQIL
jgi:hypothetical protein